MRLVSSVERDWDVAQYRLYHFHGAQVTGLDEIEAGSDRDAASLARTRAGPGSVEIWRDGRKVGTLAPTDAPQG